jgi:hypothetical protein
MALLIRSLVIGRLSRYLESIPPQTGSDDLFGQTQGSERRVELLAAQLDPEEKERLLWMCRVNLSR